MAEYREHTSEIESFLDGESDKETEEIVEEGDKDAEREKNRRIIGKKKKRRKAGDLSGRQLALKRFQRSGSQVVHLEMPPPAIKMVAAMREELLHFTDGEQDIFSDEEVSTMRV